MSDGKIKRALISVYDKTGVVEFARALVDEFGIEIISTGGTAALLKKEGIPVTLVEEVTGFPEMMDGRVKTLHPRIHAGILADRDNPEHMRQLEAQGIKPIDMVVVNLYPFEKTIADPDCTFEQAIEMIDIGGPCLLRAAAKNHRHVVVVTDPNDYMLSIDELTCWKSEKTRQRARSRGAFNAFWTTTAYDSAVSSWLSRDSQEGHPDARVMRLTFCCPLRYGENPHQAGQIAALEGDSQWGSTSLWCEEPTGDVDASFNNYADASAALDLCSELTRGFRDRSCCVFIKHGNACGAAVDVDPIEAYRKAYLGDPNAAMGGILAVNFHVDTAFADAVINTYQRWGKDAGAGGFFIEVWLALSFTGAADAWVREGRPWGKRVRLFDGFQMETPPREDEVDIKRVLGGLLLQSRDLVGLNEDQWNVVTKRPPTDTEMADLRLAWLVCKHTKSNAITICHDGMLIGNGAGQMSRVMSCRIATWLAKENGHEAKLPCSVAASDAFFPFRDGPEILIDAGVKAIIQPGGSKRDEDTIAACDERDVAMIHTGTRHFKH
jgi:phosphoribosylaminoimidazolecarboxamide formyltransferase/IMP cyclohydrolase